MAWFAGAGALSQAWPFLIAPTIGAAIAGAAIRSSPTNHRLMTVQTSCLTG
jgi:hypothetical protein